MRTSSGVGKITEREGGEVFDVGEVKVRGEVKADANVEVSHDDVRPSVAIDETWGRVGQ